MLCQQFTDLLTSVMVLPERVFKTFQTISQHLQSATALSLTIIHLLQHVDALDRILAVKDGRILEHRDQPLRVNFRILQFGAKWRVVVPRTRQSRTMLER